MASKEDIRNRAKALALGMGQGATAGLGNRGLARTRAAFTGGDYDAYLAQQEAALAESQQAYPGTYATGQAIGSVAPLMAGGAGLARAGITGIPNAALTGGLYSGIEASQEPDATLNSSMRAGAQGAGLGALAGALTSGAGGLYRGAVNRELQGSANEINALKDTYEPYPTFHPITKEPQTAYTVEPGAINQLATKEFMDELRARGGSLRDNPLAGMKRLREIEGDVHQAMTQYPRGMVNPQHAILNRAPSEITMNTLRDPRYGALADRYTPMNMMANRIAQSEVAKAEARVAAKYGNRITAPTMYEMPVTAAENQYGGASVGALNQLYNAGTNGIEAPSVNYEQATPQIGDRLRAAIAKYNSTK